MIPYTLRRFGQSLILILVTSLLTFLLFHVAGGDPARHFAGRYAASEDVAELRSHIGLDRPLPQQLLMHAKDTVTLSFGRSLETGEWVSNIFASRIGPSIWLMGPPLFMATLLTLLMALWSAHLPGGKADRVFLFTSTILLSVSAVTLVVIGQYFLAFRLNFFPVAGYEPGWPGLKFLLLPWSLWTLLLVAGDVRSYRAVFLEGSTQEWVRVARAKGVSGVRLWGQYILRPSLPFVVTRIMGHLPSIVFGSMLLESFFGIPGLGSVLVHAVHSADWPLLKAGTFLASTLVIFSSLAADLISAALHPKVHFE